MKTLAFFFAMMAGVTATSLSPPDRTSPPEDVSASRAETKAALDKLIYKNIYYPVFSKLENGSTADVTFKVEENGMLTILSIHASNSSVRSFVEGQLENVKLKKEDVMAGEMFRYRLRFKRQA
ncbi:MAG: hypothetical protein SH856_08270 [Flavobacteriales bacterium]|nr:hypothetical protein [Flavobacteriales bacterium]